jgi:hypothetical protein
MNSLYYEAHVTIDPVFGELKERVALAAAKYNFKMAKLVIQHSPTHSEEHIDDAFLSTRGDNYEDVETRTTWLVLDLKGHEVTIRRYKIEATLLDSRAKDELILLGDGPRVFMTKEEAYRTHKIRYSDSSFYDEVCALCGGTDAIDDKTLDRPCSIGAEEKLNVG